MNSFCMNTGVPRRVCPNEAGLQIPRKVVDHAIFGGNPLPDNRLNLRRGRGRCSPVAMSMVTPSRGMPPACSRSSNGGSVVALEQAG